MLFNNRKRQPLTTVVFDIVNYVIAVYFTVSVLEKLTFVTVFNLAVIFTLPVLEPFFTIPFLLTVAISLLLLVQVKLDGLRIGRAYMYGLL